MKARRPDVRVVAVQAEDGRGLPGVAGAGRPVPLESMATMADGIAVAAPGAHTSPTCRALVDEVRTVSEEDLSRALLFCLERAKLVVEPAGVAAVAAVLAEPEAFPPPVVAVISGGNIEPARAEANRLANADEANLLRTRRPPTVSSRRFAPSARRACRPELAQVGRAAAATSVRLPSRAGREGPSAADPGDGAAPAAGDRQAGRGRLPRQRP